MSNSRGGGSEYPDAILSVVNIPTNNQDRHSAKEKNPKVTALGREKTRLYWCLSPAPRICSVGYG